MKIVKIKKKGNQSLYATFLRMTLIPLCIFGIIVTIFVSYSVKRNTEEEVHYNLRNMADIIAGAYDHFYEGDYNVLVLKKSTTLYKGETLLSEDTDYIDSIKKSSGADISIFFANTRMLTTMMDSEGQRYTNTGASDTITTDILIDGQLKFYDNVNIGGKPYYAYYMPLYNGSDRVGMIGIAMQAADIAKRVRKSIYQCIAILIIFMALTALIIINFSSKIMDTIERILKFLRELTNDKLDSKLDEVVGNRADELGEIGNASVKLQKSLKRLIERDGLTNLLNRRTAEKKLDMLELQGIRSSIAIGDIDFFKKFNDNFGHACGDEVLRVVANTLNEGMRGKGYAARWGGEEFLLVFESCDETAAGVFTNQILDSVRDKVVEYDGIPHSVTMTFGVAGRLPEDTIATQIRRADEKLYNGKEAGRNRVTV